MEDTTWVVVVAAAATFAHSVTVGERFVCISVCVASFLVCFELSQAILFPAGANLIANCWGPALGAKSVSFKTALILGLTCQSIGLMLFGPEYYVLYGGLMDDWTRLAPYPQVTMYSLMWIVVTPVIWQSLAIWQKTLVPPYLGPGKFAALSFAPCRFF